MFDGLAGHWTPVEASAWVTRSARTLQVAGEDVTVRRHSGGDVVAFVRRRDGLGSPIRVWVPAHEARGLVWVFTDTRADSDAPDAAVEPGVPGARLESYVDHSSVRWSDAVERLLDEPHLPFARRDDSVGRALRHRLRPDRVEELVTQPTRRGARAQWTTRSPHGRAWIEWRRPNEVAMGIAGPLGDDLVVHAWCVPVDETSTRLVLLTERSPHAALVTPGPPPSVAPRAPSGALSERFRRWYHRYGKRSSAPVPYQALGLRPVV